MGRLTRREAILGLGAAGMAPLAARAQAPALPKLRAASAKDDVLHRITVDNPRRFLAFTPKRPRRPTRA